MSFAFREVSVSAEEVADWQPVAAAWPGALENRVKRDAYGRLHARRYVTGWRVHRDHLDPDRSPLHAAAHVLIETPVGIMLALAAMGAFVYARRSR